MPVNAYSMLDYYHEFLLFQEGSSRPKLREALEARSKEVPGQHHRIPFGTHSDVLGNAQDICRLGIRQAICLIDV